LLKNPSLAARIYQYLEYFQAQKQFDQQKRSYETEYLYLLILAAMFVCFCPIYSKMEKEKTPQPDKNEI